MKWLFNFQLVGGAIIGAAFVASLFFIEEARSHKGSGVIHHEQGSHTASEAEYRQYNEGMGWMMIGLCVLFYYGVAQAAKPKK